LAAGGTAPPEASEECFTGDFMLKDLETSLAFCRDSLGLGIRG
jgi:hypothetical protein